MTTYEQQASALSDEALEHLRELIVHRPAEGIEIVPQLCRGCREIEEWARGVKRERDAR